MMGTLDSVNMWQAACATCCQGVEACSDMTGMRTDMYEDSVKGCAAPVVGVIAFAVAANSGCDIPPMLYEYLCAHMSLANAGKVLYTNIYECLFLSASRNKVLLSECSIGVMQY